jgi:hypothetical protein
VIASGCARFTASVFRNVSWSQHGSLKTEPQQIDGVFSQDLALIVLGNLRALCHWTGHLARL